jgi:hypothetical protein
LSELQLPGGRVTEGVVRIGDTVRRPLAPNASFRHALLAHLSAWGFDAAPQYLGTDDVGREILSFLPGDVPAELDASLPDDALRAAAGLIRRFHDATAGSQLAGQEEVVCHNDLSPCNFVFLGQVPVGIIDFDGSAPGSRISDLGYAIFLWLNLGTDGPEGAEQARRIRLFCDGYGIEADDRVLDGIDRAVTANAGRLRAAGRLADVVWWEAQLAWIRHHREDLVVRSD